MMRATNKLLLLCFIMLNVVTLNVVAPKLLHLSTQCYCLNSYIYMSWLHNKKRNNPICVVSPKVAKAAKAGIFVGASGLASNFANVNRHLGDEVWSF
jgi:hypothetical protein